MAAVRGALSSSAVVALLILTSACKRAERATADLPAGIDRIALLHLDASGALASATPIAAWEPGAALPIAAEDGAVIVGWASGTFAAAGLSTDAAKLGSATLVRSTGCAPSLPAPDWAAAWPSLATVSVAALPALGAPWLEGQCPSLVAPTAYVDMPCLTQPCHPAAVRVGPCRFALDLSECGAGPVEVAVDAAGRVCVDLAASGLSCARSLRFSDEPYTCVAEGCALTAHVVDTAAAPPFEVARTGLGAGGRASGAYLPETVANNGGFQPTDPRTGFAFDLAVLSDRVVVATPEGTEPVIECARREGGAQRLRIFDLESLSEIATATAPRCADHLLADGTGETFLAPFALDGEPWSLGRFDRTGRLIARGSTSVDGRTTFEAEQLVRIPSGELAIVFSQTDATARPQRLTIHDGGTLAVLRDFELRNEQRIFVLAVWDEHTLVAISRDAQNALWIDVDSGDVVTRVALRNDYGRHWNFFDLFVDAPSGRAVALAQGSNSLWAVPRAGEIGYGGLYQREAVLTASADWPPDPGLRLFAASAIGASGSDRRVLLGTFTPAGLRVRPELWDVGYGAAARLAGDARGRVWALLPWSGEVLRLTPRTP